MVVKEAAIAFEVEGDHVSESDVETGTGPESRRDLVVLPKITVNELVLHGHSLIVVESVVHADTTEDVRIEGTVIFVTSEDRSDVSHKVNGTFNIIELVNSGRAVHSTFTLPSIDIQPCAENRRELIAE